MFFKVVVGALGKEGKKDVASVLADGRLTKGIEIKVDVVDADLLRRVWCGFDADPILVTPIGVENFFYCRKRGGEKRMVFLCID